MERPNGNGKSSSHSGTLTILAAGGREQVARLAGSINGHELRLVDPSKGDAAATSDVILFACSGRPTSVELKELRRSAPCAGGADDIPIVIVLQETDTRRARKLLEDGVAGIVVEEDIEETLEPTLRAVATGQLVYPRRLRVAAERPNLSYREKQVLGMVVMGFSNREIATKLWLAESTIKSHLSSAFGKLGVRSRSEAAALILDPHEGLGTGILAISGPGRRSQDVDDAEA